MKRLDLNNMRSVSGGAVTMALSNVRTFKKFMALAEMSGDKRVLAIGINNFHMASGDYAALYKTVRQMIGPVQASNVATLA